MFLRSVVGSAPLPHFFAPQSLTLDAPFYGGTKEFGSLKNKKKREKENSPPTIGIRLNFSRWGRWEVGGGGRRGGEGTLCKGESRAAKSIHPTRVRGTALLSVLPSVQTFSVSLTFFHPNQQPHHFGGVCWRWRGRGGGGGGVNLIGYSRRGGRTHRLGDGF